MILPELIPVLLLLVYPAVYFFITRNKPETTNKEEIRIVLISISIALIIVFSIYSAIQIGVMAWQHFFLSG